MEVESDEDQQATLPDPQVTYFTHLTQQTENAVEDDATWAAADKQWWARYKRARAFYDNSHDTPFNPSWNTSGWITATAQYKHWKMSLRSVLCISGSPGSGKSYLLWQMANNPKEIASSRPLGAQTAATAPTEPLAFYYSSTTDWPDGSVSTILEALLFNTLQADPSQRREFVPLTSPMEYSQPGPELCDAIASAVAKVAKGRRVFWFVDGPNEPPSPVQSGGSTQSLFAFFDTLMSHASAASVQLHICYTKRDYPVTKPSSLLTTGGCYYSELRMDDHNTTDIEGCVFSTLMSLNPHLKHEKLVEMMNEILNRAGTGFRAAVAYAQLGIDSRPPPGHDGAMRALPRDLSAMWGFILDRLEQCGPTVYKRVLALISCVMAAQTPLTLREFSLVCDFPLGEDPEGYRSVFVMHTFGLLKPVPRIPGESHPTTYCVALVQPSLAAYLQWAEGIGRPGTTALSGESHRQFAEWGIQQLGSWSSSYFEDWSASLPPYAGPELSSGNKTTPSYRGALPQGLMTALESPMATYTLRYLMVHVSQLEDSGQVGQLFQALNRPYAGSGVCREDDCLLAMWCHLHNFFTGSSVYGPGVSSWHIAVQYDMSKYLIDTPDAWDLNLSTRNGQTLLHWAAYYTAQHSMDVLLNRALEKQVEEWPQPGMEDELVVVNRAHGLNRTTALHLAAKKGHMGIVESLLKYNGLLRKRLDELPRMGSRSDPGGVYLAIDAPSANGLTALYYAVMSRTPAIVTVLLRLGADWRWPTVAGESLLEFAIRKTSHEYPMDPNAKQIVRILRAASFADVGLASGLDPRTEPADSRFHARAIRFVEGEQHITEMPIVELLNDYSLLGGAVKGTWIHLPANNMVWAEALILHVFSLKDTRNPTASRDSIMPRKLWTDRHIRGSARSYISFMRPGFGRLAIPSGLYDVFDCMAVFMPYLHWETQARQSTLEMFALCKYLLELNEPTLHKVLSQLVSENHELLHNPKNDPRLEGVGSIIRQYLDSADDPKVDRGAVYRLLQVRLTGLKKGFDLCDPDLCLLDAYASNQATSHPVHPRRTLDQSFYFMLDSTTRRNQDQVVTRYGRESGRKQPVVLMVDQLWIWQVDDVVISCFPQRRERSFYDPDRYDTTDVLENVISRLSQRVLDFTDRRDVLELVLCIIDECIGTCFDPMKNLDSDFKFLDMFNNSLNRVADEEMSCYERFVDSLKEPGGQHDQLPINTEFHLLREIKDIIEELQMMRQIFDNQQGVLAAMAEECPNEDSGVIAPVADAGKRYINKIDLMLAQAERTNNAINNLMDLRQRHATLSEAQATGRQGNTIMVFTVVTIVFLPASFMASFFALPVAQFSRDSGGENMDLTYIVRWLLAFTIPVAAFFIYSAFYINEVLAVVTRLVLRTKRGTVRMKIRTSHAFLGVKNWAISHFSRSRSLRVIEDPLDDPEIRPTSEATEPGLRLRRKKKRFPF